MQSVNNAAQVNSTSQAKDPRAYCIWEPGTLLHHGIIPCARDQQESLYRKLSQHSLQWEYADDDDDRITIQTLQDLIEACDHTNHPVLHIHPKHTPTQKSFDRHLALDCSAHSNQQALNSKVVKALHESALGLDQDESLQIQHDQQLSHLETLDPMITAKGLRETFTEALIAFDGASQKTNSVTPADKPADSAAHEMFVDINLSDDLATQHPISDEFRQLKPSALLKHLHTHCESGDLNKVSSCLSAAADRVWLANSTRGMGSTPLMVAAKNDHADVVQALLIADANPMATNWFGKSSIEYAHEYAQKNPESFDFCTLLQLQQATERQVVLHRAAMIQGCSAQWRAEIPFGVCKIVAQYHVHMYGADGIT